MGWVAERETLTPKQAQRKHPVETRLPQPGRNDLQLESGSFFVWINGFFISMAEHRVTIRSVVPLKDALGPCSAA
jgi:hypothetical protein